jgi:hypothetical protein
MLRSSLRAVVFGAAVLWTASAYAKDDMIYFNCSTQISRGAVTTVYSSGIFLAPVSMYATREFAKAFKEFLISQGLNAPYAGCSTSYTPEKAFKGLDYAEDFAHRQKGRFEVVEWAPSGGRVIKRGERPDTQNSKTLAGETKAADSPSNKTTETAGKTRAEYEAEWQAKLAAHETALAEYNQKTEAREAEIARQQSQHTAAQEEAQRARQAHEAKMEAHRLQLAEAQRRREEWLAVKRRHDRCVAGDRQACENMAAGKPASDEKLAEAGKPKTSDDEARTCVTSPVVSASKTWKGALQAVAFNGCTKPVDIRICLLRSGGWNCGMQWGVKPQDRFTHFSFETKGEIFWDARMAGSSLPLASPGSD